MGDGALKASVGKVYPHENWMKETKNVELRAKWMGKRRFSALLTIGWLSYLYTKQLRPEDQK